MNAPASTQMKDIRDAYFDAVYAIGEKDPQVIIITNDMDVFSLRKFKQNFPDRFINVGVAEQNMINVAAGLASCGKKPLVFGISSFVTFRCYEQLRFNVASMKLPVVIAGIGSGFAFSHDGPTHHGTQDVAVARAIPGVTIFNPGDTVAAEACAHLSFKANGPVFARVDKGLFPALHDLKADFTKGYGVLRPLAEVNILATGYMTPIALDLAAALAKQGLHVGIVDVFRLHPLWTPDFAANIIARSKKIVTLEENAITGGLGSAVAEGLADAGSPTHLLRLATADEQALVYGSREWLLARDGLDIAAMSTRVRAFAT